MRHTAAKKGSNSGTENIPIVLQSSRRRIDSAVGFHTNQAVRERPAISHVWIYLDHLPGIRDHLLVYRSQRQQQRNFGILRQERLDLHIVPQ